MRPNIDEIRKRLNKASRNEKWFAQDGESIYVTWYSGRDVQLAQTIRPAWHEDHFKGDEEACANAEFIAHSRTDIPALLAYIDELENMPLVQRLVEQSSELEFLRKLKKLPLVQTAVEQQREIERLQNSLKSLSTPNHDYELEEVRDVRKQARRFLEDDTK